MSQAGLGLLYRRLGPLRYVWWLLWVSIADALRVPGVHAGVRWRVVCACLAVSFWSYR
jgi:hypothetical protein